MSVVLSEHLLLEDFTEATNMLEYSRSSNIHPSIETRPMPSHPPQRRHQFSAFPAQTVGQPLEKLMRLKSFILPLSKPIRTYRHRG
jgi:hypothetical protein